MTKIRVVVVDDSAFIRQVIRNALMAQPDMDVVGWGQDGREAIEATDRLRPDVVTLDWDMFGSDGLAMLSALRSLASPPGVVMVTSADPDVPALLASGADAIVAKSSSATLDMPQLIGAVRAAARAAGHTAAR